MAGSCTTLMTGSKLRYVNAVLTWWGRMVSGVIAVSRVYPSGLACMASVTPTAPPPPGLLTTTTAFPRYFEVLAARARNTRSVAPPAAYGTMIWTSLVGNSAA